MRCTIHETLLRYFDWRHNKKISRWEIAINSLTDPQPVTLRGCNFREAPNGQTAPLTALVGRGRKELPIAYSIACGAIGDIVSGKGKALNTDQNVAVF